MVKEEYFDSEGNLTVVEKKERPFNIYCKELDESSFKKLDKPSYDLENENQKFREDLKLAYDNLIDILKEYLDLDEENYNIIALWIIGTYFHNNFPSYPFLFFNAMKGSGKSRAMNLITHLSWNGNMCASMTEAVLFRTNGTLGIDEFEGVNRKGMENLRELLNACYKRGIKVQRMKQKKTPEGTEQVVEEFLIYRPIVLANIFGMESVLGDRCIQLILDKSNRIEVTNLIEIFPEEIKVIETKKLLSKCSLCRSVVTGEVYREWNSYIKSIYTNYTNYTNYTYNTNYTNTFEIIRKMELNGRELELSLPLCMVANAINESILHQTTLKLHQIFSEKKDEELTENQDVNLIDFISNQLHTENFITLNSLLRKFKDAYGITEDWINVKWLGKSLKRLNLIKMKRRLSRGVEVVLDYNKSKEKIKLFREQKPKDE